MFTLLSLQLLGSHYNRINAPFSKAVSENVLDHEYDYADADLKNNATEFNDYDNFSKESPYWFPSSEEQELILELDNLKLRNFKESELK